MGKRYEKSFKEEVLGKIRSERKDAAGAPLTLNCYRAASNDDTSDT